MSKFFWCAPLASLTNCRAVVMNAFIGRHCLFLASFVWFATRHWLARRHRSHIVGHTGTSIRHGRSLLRDRTRRASWGSVASVLRSAFDECGGLCGWGCRVFHSGTNLVTLL